MILQYLDSLVFSDDHGNVLIADNVTVDTTRVLIPNGYSEYDVYSQYSYYSSIFKLETTNF